MHPLEFSAVYYLGDIQARKNCGGSDQGEGLG